MPMWCLTATAKPHATPQTIAAKRHQWLSQGKDRLLRARCRSAQRFVAEHGAPLRVWWLLDTDDQTAVGLITEHFGDLWEIDVCQVTPQAISEFLGS